MERRHLSSPFFWIVLVMVFTFENISFAGDTQYIESLLEKAIEDRLCEDRYWNILLHYKKTLFGMESQIDDPRFFISPEGKKNPEKELIATIRQLFITEDETLQVDVCNYIARYTWLKDRLNVDFTKVRALFCGGVENVNARSAVLAFPGYYMNNPASMFGHTFLNIRTDFKNDLLANAVNFAARTDETNGFIFAYKGIFGMYKGYYSVLPYYKKILEYSDMDKRDIWEYELNLTPDELDLMVRHIRELEDIYMDYFFFDENCSYNLLFLLESARPSLNLTDAFSHTVLPIDTVKLMKKEGVIASSKYRPSSVSKIKGKSEKLSKSLRELSRDIVNDTCSPGHVLDSQMDNEEKISVLDVSVDILRHRLMKKEMTKEQYQKLLLRILKIRSKLGKKKHPVEINTPRQPEETHDSALVRMGAGNLDDTAYFQFSFRPTFNDICDPDFPDKNGMQIQFFNTTVNYYFKEEKLKLKALDVIDIKSIASRDAIFKPLSWKIKTGFKREYTADIERHLVSFINGGAGVSYFHPFCGLFYSILNAEMDVSRYFDKDFTVGVGLEAGVVKRIIDPWKVHLNGELMGFIAGDTHPRRHVTLSQRFRLSKNFQLELSNTLARDYHHSYQNHLLSLFWYF